MSDRFVEQRRSDDRMAERVECGIALLSLAGVEDASRYLRNCGVPPEVVCRVLSTAIARSSMAGTSSTIGKVCCPAFRDDTTLKVFARNRQPLTLERGWRCEQALPYPRVRLDAACQRLRQISQYRRDCCVWGRI